MSNTTDQSEPTFVERLLSGAEPPISIKAAAKLLGRDGRPANRGMIYRYIQSGLLDSASLRPRSLVTSALAVRRFVERLDEKRRTRAVSPPPPSAKLPTERPRARRHHAAAMRELKAEGLVTG